MKIVRTKPCYMIINSQSFNFRLTEQCIKECSNWVQEEIDANILNDIDKIMNDNKWPNNNELEEEEDEQ